MRLTVYRVADPGWRMGRNVYREILTSDGVGVTIGYAVVTWRWCWSLVWRRP